MPPKYVKAIRPSAVSGPEAAVADRAEVVGVQRAGHPGDERSDAEAGELRVADVDPGRRCGALVRAHGQHPLPEAAPPHVGDEQGEQDRHREDEEAEDRARDVVVQAAEATRPGRGRRRQGSAAATGEPLGPPPQRVFRKPNCSIATAAASVTTARLTPRTRSADTAISSPTTVADDGADQQRDGERGPDPADVRREMGHREARDAGERELHDGDLADEADDDDEREADEDAEERVDQRLAEVVREHDQRERRRRPQRSRSA